MVYGYYDFMTGMDNIRKGLSTPKKTAYGAVIIALAIALGYALALIPNVELVTLTLAVGGYILGASWGVLIGAIGFGLYSILSPYGVAPPPLLFAQIIGGAVIGLGGSLLRMWALSDDKAVRTALYAALVGILVTFIYDLLTNLGSYVVIASKATLGPFLIGGLSFSVLHIVVNGVIFALLFPVISKLLKKAGPRDFNFLRR